MVEILGGDLKKTFMVGDSETDSNEAKAAGIRPGRFVHLWLPNFLSLVQMGIFTFLYRLLTLL